MKEVLPVRSFMTELADSLGLIRNRCLNWQWKITRRILPPTVRSMNDVIREMFVKDGMPEEMADMMVGEMPPERSMWVISNGKQGVNGAISMLYEDKLHKLAENIESDLYILPSSVHEVIAVSADMGEPDELAQMVNEINTDQVALGRKTIQSGVSL